MTSTSAGRLTPIVLLLTAACSTSPDNDTASPAGSGPSVESPASPGTEPSSSRSADLGRPTLSDGAAAYVRAVNDGDLEALVRSYDAPPVSAVRVRAGVSRAGATGGRPRR
ncbi:hypothetical protein CLV30_108102 [Haloactinopolyspora alba]|uniref:Uncharacterized protein n=1 Tax=Haloactinopolyspora alba TaxID=648780 RepID=A0A2P8E145_9ACTN|nr:hypothetical protein [Haloactinopolyspora alba]PSL03190.1 hypothetical protein CLV30_108102 [Haloactinopolyspora alba]